MKRLLLLAALTAVIVAAQPCVVSQQYPGSFICTVDGTTGALQNKYVKWNATGTGVVLGATTDTQGVVGIAAASQTGGGGLLVTRYGPALVAFDGATTSGHYATISSSVAGGLTDAGTSVPSDLIGVILQTIGSAGNAWVDLRPFSKSSSASGVSDFNTRTGSVSGVSGDIPIATNAQTGTTYTVVAGDKGKSVTLCNASPVAVSLPQATGSFTAGWYTFLKNDCAGTVTVTPTTSTIAGAATLTLETGEFALVPSDGTNYEAYTNRITAGSNIFVTKSRTGTQIGTGTTFGATFDGGGSALTAGTTVARIVTIPVACTIKSWDISVDTGTATFKVWKIASGTAIPTISNSINTSGIAISTGTALHSTTLSDFTTTSISANDIVGVNLSAVTGSATLATLGVICN